MLRQLHAHSLVQQSAQFLCALCRYFYERTYESGGLMFEFVFNRIMICQLIFVFFTGCVFIVKRGEVKCLGRPGLSLFQCFEVMQCLSLPTDCGDP